MRSIIPESANFLVTDDGDCVEIAFDPNCTTAWFSLGSIPLEKRAQLVRNRALENGWTFGQPASRGPGGRGFLFVRDGYTAHVSLVTDRLLRTCNRVRLCRDNIHIVRK
jgi:hypothetical protein